MVLVRTTLGRAFQWYMPYGFNFVFWNRESLFSVQSFRSEGVKNILKKDMEEDEKLLKAFNMQIQYMDDLGEIKCVFCFLSRGTYASHVSESCFYAPSWAGIGDPNEFKTQVRSWSRIMPFPVNHKVKYCGFCRFPNNDLFHKEAYKASANQRGCIYNDILNRLAWAFWHNKKYHKAISVFSQGAVSVTQGEEKCFKAWLLEERHAGITNLFSLLIYILRGKVIWLCFLDNFVFGV